MPFSIWLQFAYSHHICAQKRESQIFWQKPKAPFHIAKQIKYTSVLLYLEASLLQPLSCSTADWSLSLPHTVFPEASLHLHPGIPFTSLLHIVCLLDPASLSFLIFSRFDCTHLPSIMKVAKRQHRKYIFEPLHVWWFYFYPYSWFIVWLGIEF